MKLYQQLVAALSSQGAQSSVMDPIPNNEWNKYIEKAEKLSETHASMLYALIVYYDFSVTSEVHPYPYDAKNLSESGGVILQTAKLPAPLQHLIAEFLQRV
jgi:hypothetical protein